MLLVVKEETSVDISTLILSFTFDVCCCLLKKKQVEDKIACKDCCKKSTTTKKFLTLILSVFDVTCLMLLVKEETSVDISTLVLSFTFDV